MIIPSGDRVRSQDVERSQREFSNLHDAVSTAVVNCIDTDSGVLNTNSDLAGSLISSLELSGVDMSVIDLKGYQPPMQNLLRLRYKLSDEYEDPIDSLSSQGFDEDSVQMVTDIRDLLMSRLIRREIDRRIMGDDGVPGIGEIITDTIRKFSELVLLESTSLVSCGDEIIIMNRFPNEGPEKTDRTRLETHVRIGFWNACEVLENVDESVIASTHVDDVLYFLIANQIERLLQQRVEWLYYVGYTNVRGVDCYLESVSANDYTEVITRYPVRSSSLLEVVNGILEREDFGFRFVVRERVRF